MSESDYSEFRQIVFYLAIIPLAAIVHIVGKFILGIDAWIILCVQMPLLVIQIVSGIMHIRFLRRQHKIMEDKIKKEVEILKEKIWQQK